MLFWKKFGQARDANRLFNQASEQWRLRQRLLGEGDEENESKACAEVVRLCQLSIRTDERMGDAYVLLANALTVAASHGAGRSDKERHEFLQSRAAAVLYFWYTLPHRGYPITKNITIGERLWTIMVDDICQDKSLSKHATMGLMESYKDSLATETISPNSFEKIKAVIVSQTKTNPEQTDSGERLEEISLPPETLAFLVGIIPKTLESGAKGEQMPTDQVSPVKRVLDMAEDTLAYIENSKTALDATQQLLEQIEKAYDNNDLRDAVGWLRWLFTLQLYHVKHLPDSTPKEEVQERYGRVVELLKATINKAREVKDYDALLLAAGMCDWIGLSPWANQVLEIVTAEIGKQSTADRLTNIKRAPRMFVDGLLVDRLDHYLGKR